MTGNGKTPSKEVGATTRKTKRAKKTASEAAQGPSETPASSKKVTPSGERSPAPLLADPWDPSSTSPLPTPKSSSSSMRAKPPLPLPLPRESSTSSGVMRTKVGQFLAGDHPLEKLHHFGELAELYGLDPLRSLIDALPSITCDESMGKLLSYFRRNKISSVSLGNENKVAFTKLVKFLSPQEQVFTSPVVEAWSFIRIVPERGESMSDYIRRFNEVSSNTSHEDLVMALFLHSLQNSEMSDRILEHSPKTITELAYVAARVYGIRGETPWGMRKSTTSPKFKVAKGNHPNNASKPNSSQSSVPVQGKGTRRGGQKHKPSHLAKSKETCTRCGHTGHSVSKCFAKKHINGTRFDGQPSRSESNSESGGNQRVVRGSNRVLAPPPPPPRPLAKGSSSLTSVDHHSDTSESEGEVDPRMEDYLDIATDFDDAPTVRLVAKIRDIELDVLVNGKPVKAVLDSGADESMLLYKPWMADALVTTGIRPMRTADCSPFVPKGYLTAEVEWNGTKFERYLAVVDSLTNDMLLGKDWLHFVDPHVDFKAMTATLRSEGTSSLISSSAQHVFDEFPAVCAELESLPPSRGKLDFSIDLVPNANPPKFYLIRLSQPEMEEAKRTVDLFLDRGWISPITSPDYVFPLLFVKKKDNTMRMCVDYKGLNKLTVKKRYPLKLMDELIEMAAGCDWFSLIDLKKAYHQILIKEEDRPKTSFRFMGRCYMWNVLPFGVSNGPNAFQAIIDDIFGQCDPSKVSAYLDDICIHTNGSLDDHMVEVRRVLQLLQDNHLHISRKKCEVAVKQVAWIGHMISSDGAQPIPDKIPPILSIPIPRTVSELRSFLGSVQYYAKYFRNLSKAISPLLRHLQGPKKGSKRRLLDWTLEDTAIFNKVKKSMANLPSLFPFRKVPRDADLQIYTDASDFAIGAVIQYKGQPLQFYSASLSVHERLWPIRQKELYAALRALRKWRHWVLGRHVQIYTDHKSLSSMLVSDKRIQENRLARWSLELAEYDIEFLYVKGEDNIVADCLSRVRFIESLTDHSPINPSLDDYRRDPYWSKVLESIKSFPQYVATDKHILFNDKLCIPQSLKSRVLKLAHDHPSSGHRGVLATQKRVSRHFYWVGLYEDVRKYVVTCHRCMLAKGGRRLKVPLQPLPVAPYPWHTVTMDLITDLPLTRQGYDAIYVFVDKFSKTVHLAPCSKTIDAEGCLDVFMREIYRLHGLPEVLVSDRDPRFTSELYRRAMGKFAVVMRMSTSGHAQTDGQTERANRVVGEMIRAYSTSNDSLWVEYLPTIEFAINSSPSAATGISPFEATNGILPRQIGFARRSLPDEDASLESNLMRLRHIQQQTLKRLDVTFQKALPDDPARPVFAVGEAVYIDSQLFKDEESHLRRPKTSAKVRGPFKVKKVFGPSTYEIDFLGFPTRIHKVINVKYLRPTSGTPRAVTRPNADPDGNYEVESILGSKKFHGKTHYRVKWKGFPEHESTWEPPEHFQDKTASSLLGKYRVEEEKAAQAAASKRRSQRKKTNRKRNNSTSSSKK